jgi:hypothetical protein
MTVYVVLIEESDGPSSPPFEAYIYGVYATEESAREVLVTAEQSARSRCPFAYLENWEVQP